MKNVIWIISFSLAIPVFAQAAEGDAPEHFNQGELRASLSWDNILAMETGSYKFGASAGVHLINGLELGMEQQFILPPESGAESRTWSYVRLVPLRRWTVSPFLSPRVGYYNLDGRHAAAVGAGVGAVMFVSEHMAFEVSAYTQWVFRGAGQPERQLDFDWRMVIFL